MKRSPPPGTPWLLRIAATFFCIGEAAPIAPATAASLVLVPVLYPFLDLSPWTQGLITLVVIGFAIDVSTRAERYYGHDAGAITIDEVAGMLVTFLFVSAGEGVDRWAALGAGFFLFRIMDIVKPFPAGRAQHLPRGWGVVLDDVLAGVYANIALRLLLAWFRN